MESHCLTVNLGVNSPMAGCTYCTLPFLFESIYICMFATPIVFVSNWPTNVEYVTSTDAFSRYVCSNLVV